MSEKQGKFAIGCVYSFLIALYVLMAVFFFKYIAREVDWSFAITILLFAVIATVIMFKYSHRKPVIKMNRRDNFEGRYQNFITMQKIMIVRRVGQKALNAIQDNSLFVEELFRALLNHPGVKTNSDDRFMVLIGIGHALWDFADIDGAMSYLKLAKDIKPDDLIVNAELAWAYEAKNNSDEAIKCYEAALKDGSITEPIKAYFASEIERVKTKGPRTVPPFTGLRLFA